MLLTSRPPIVTRPDSGSRKRNRRLSRWSCPPRSRRRARAAAPARAAGRMVEHRWAIGAVPHGDLLQGDGGRRLGRRCRRDRVVTAARPVDQLEHAPPGCERRRELLAAPGSGATPSNEASASSATVATSTRSSEPAECADTAAARTPRSSGRRPAREVRYRALPRGRHGGHGARAPDRPPNGLEPILLAAVEHELGRTAQQLDEVGRHCAAVERLALARRAESAPRAAARRHRRAGARPRG